MTKVTKPNGDTIEFTYYATGQRAKKVLKVGEDTTTWKYHWDGDIPVKIEKEGGDPAYFTFRAQGDILTMTYQNNTYYYITNIRGDVVALLDRYGNEAASYKYDIWGNPTITNPNNLPNPFLYQGAYATFHDSEFAMYGMGARHYNPKTMRFISRDFNHGSLTNTMSQNLYIHCYNNPIGYKDPSGFSPSCGGRSSFRGSNDTDNFGPGDDPNPRPDGTPPEPQLTKEQQELWDWCGKNGIEFASKQQFVNLWNQANSLIKELQQYKEGPNGYDYNKFDFKIAFWTCYWNDKAKLGLNWDNLVDFANLIKAQAYLETHVGLNDHSTQGILQVTQGTLSVAEELGYLPRGFSSKYGNRIGTGDTSENAGFFAGIAVWVMGLSGKQHYDPNDPNAVCNRVPKGSFEYKRLDTWLSERALPNGTYKPALWDEIRVKSTIDGYGAVGFDINNKDIAGLKGGGWRPHTNAVWSLLREGINPYWWSKVEGTKTLVRLP